MRTAIRRAVVVGASSALALTGLTTVAQAAASPRTTVDAAPAWTAATPAVAQTPASTPQTMTVVLKLRDAAGAEALAAAVSDPASATYGHYVSPAAWRARFAPTDAQVAAVTTWLKAQGFTVGSIPANHRTISFSGTSAQAEAAFGTDLKVYAKDGNRVSAPATSLSVPTALAGTIEGIGGLDRSARARPTHTTGDLPSPKVVGKTSLGATAVQPKTTLPGPPDVFRNSNPCSTYYGEKAAPNFPQAFGQPLTYVPCGYKPAQLRGAYGVDQALSQGYDGRGATVAIIDAFASPTILFDAQTYAATNDPRHPLRSYQFSQNLPLTYNSIDECGGNGWYGEETLDVEAVHAMAPAANILYVGASSCYDNDLEAAMNTIVDNNLAQIITNSYGETESDGAATADAWHQTFLQAAAQGISVTYSSGDDGDELENSGLRQTDLSASDPMVTAVGGTSLAVGASNNYLFETGWSTTSATLKNGKWGPAAFQAGAGGGTSRLFTQPAYQKGVVPASISQYYSTTPHRAVPDVAMDADAQTGLLVGETQAFPDGSVRYSQYRIGGTSLSSPLFAGLLAVTDQVAGRSLGFVNPRLYKLAGTSALHDVVAPAKTVGVVRVNYVNSVDGSDGLATVLRQFGAKESIYARPGYDDVTGVGTPNGPGFFSAMATGRATAATGSTATGPIVKGQPTR